MTNAWRTDDKDDDEGDTNSTKNDPEASLSKFSSGVPPPLAAAPLLVLLPPLLLPVVVSRDPGDDTHDPADALCNAVLPLEEVQGQLVLEAGGRLREADHEAPAPGGQDAAVVLRVLDCEGIAPRRPRAAHAVGTLLEEGPVFGRQPRRVLPGEELLEALRVELDAATAHRARCRPAGAALLDPLAHAGRVEVVVAAPDAVAPHGR
mmetsp:Transcript_23591/g.66164  ORF Transcript_23591/g.66164 Transcript_23591/m.66164 type:complete len:206 (-) Transcript_23591:184-801(-)